MHFHTDAYVRNLINAVEQQFDYRKVQDGDWTSWQRRFRERLTDMTGLSAIREASKSLPLQPKRLNTIQTEEYIREKWIIQTEQDVWIPFYFLKPAGEDTNPLPVMITPHGHGRRGKEVYVGNYADEAERSHAEEGERDIALQAVRNGYAVIAPDQRGFWEMGREEDMKLERRDSCEDLQKKAMLFGRTLIGERVHDIGRLIDFIEQQSDLDASRIGITGNSGGGTTSLLAAALDERIALCMPSAYFCTFHGSVLTLYHCPCNIIPGILTLGEMYNIAGLVAPRPMLVIHGKDDELFPSPATREAVNHAAKIYEFMHVKDRFEYYEGDGGHRYFKAPAWPFAERHLT